MKPSIVIIEDHPLYRDALINLIKNEFPGLRIKGEAELKKGIQLIKAENKIGKFPAIILLDLTLPQLAGVTAVYQLVAEYPNNPLIIVSASEDYMQVTSCLHAGAKIFINKAAPPQLIISSIRKLMEGDEIYANWIDSNGERTVDTRHAIKLTERQLEVLTLICEGKSNRKIAEQLEVAEITAKAHVSAIFRELKVVNRTQAVLAAQRLGFVASIANQE